MQRHCLGGLEDICVVTETLARSSAGSRWYSTEIHNGESVKNSTVNAPDFTYHGPFSSAVTKVKKLSLFSCCVTLGAGPVMMVLDGGTSMMAKLSLAGTLSSFGLATTGLLHWFTHPYVHQLRYYDEDKAIDVETLNFLAKKSMNRIPLDSIESGAEGSLHPLSTFRANGKVFYVDKEYFMDKELLALLSPEEDGGVEHDTPSASTE